MAVIDVSLLDESQSRYLTYALSVVTGRALPDVRDGLKPVQRRILYAMAEHLHLAPEKAHRKSAAVVGEVLARFHPHGDSACYDALVRMAQDFSMRYPLIDGQGNFGSQDGDSAAAYRYTEARLTPIALEVVGDIGQDTIAERDNFDQTVKEPVVLPSRVPNLLMNGSSGIAVGMATSIPPHNLTEVVKALLLLLDDPQVADARLFSAVKGPDFPTGAQVLNSKKEIKEIYTSGRGAFRIRADYQLEKASRGKQQVVITSIPYAVDKSQVVEKIADLIIQKRLRQFADVRDESTDKVRIVLELTNGAHPDKGMAYLYKHTNLQTNFNVNLTALLPTGNPLAGKPQTLSLRELLQHFIDFRLDVTKRKLLFEKKKLEDRVHLLQGLMLVLVDIQEAIRLVQKSSGRQEAATALKKRFRLTEKQAFFVVDLRIYQLSRTSVGDVQNELAEKRKRILHINAILKSKKKLNAEVGADLERISAEYGDKRRTTILTDFEEQEYDEEEFIEHEDVFVVVTRDGWIKRIRSTNDPSTTRVREGDELFFVAPSSTKNSLALFTNKGNVFIQKIWELSQTTGYGDPVQKLFRFQDGEIVASCLLVDRDVKGFSEQEILLFSSGGMGLRLKMELLTETKKTGKRLIRLKEGDELRGVVRCGKKLFVGVSEQGYGLCFLVGEIPLLTNGGRGVVMQKLPREDRLVFVESVNKRQTTKVIVKSGAEREVNVSAMTIGGRAKRGLKVIKRGAPVLGGVPSLMLENDSGAEKGG